MTFSNHRRRIAVAAATAVLAATALLAPTTSAHAAPTTTITGPGSFVAANRTLSYTAVVATSAWQWRAYVQAVSTRLASPSKPQPISYTTPESADKPFTLYVQTSVSNTPGHYRLFLEGIEGSTTVSQASLDLYVYANLSYSRSQSFLGWPAQKLGKKYRTTFTVRAPRYQAGALATVYYRANGKKSYIKVAAGRISTSGAVTVRTAKGKIRKKGRVYLKVGSVIYCGAYILPTKALR